MKPETIAQIIERSLRGQLNDEEQRVLDQWKKESPLNEELYDQLQDPQYVAREVQLFREADWQKAFERFQEEHPFQQSRTPVIRRYWVAAASVVLLFAVGLYYYFFSGSSPSQKVVNNEKVTQQSVVLPASRQATLILADNKTIQLNNAPTGEVVRDASASVQKTAEGELRYEGVGKSSNTVYHTLVIPRGGFYNLTLADGTKVWLNAGSSLRFPATFSGKERKVTLSGEAYFEVKKNKEMPFWVETDKGAVQVLGTHFDIKHYRGEPMFTTLIEGSVKVASEQATANKILVPGQQAVIRERSSTINVNKVNVALATGWKNGVFAFNRASLKDMMNELVRWYDIDVVYHSDVQSSAVFMGEFDRNIELSILLKQLGQMSDLNFDIQGRTVTVSMAPVQ